MSKQVIVFPRGQLAPKDRERLTKAGYLAVEADSPHLVVACVPGAPMASADDMLLSAMHAMNFDSSQAERARFTSELYRRMKAKELLP